MDKINAMKGLNELSQHFVDFFWGIGYFGWQISALYAIYVSIVHSWLYFFVFIFIFLFSGWVNHSVLKDYINDPRPSDSTPFLDSEHFRKNSNGMPSGHAQQTAFALTFAYLLTGRGLYQSWALFLITVVQRYVFKNHTAPQLLVGSILGFLVAYLTVFLLNKWKEYALKKKNKKDK